MVEVFHHAIVVAHTHWDREWYATFEQFRIRLVRLIDNTIALLENNPHFQYFTLDGQTIVLEDYLAIRPENEQRLRSLVRSGRLLVGPWYILPDEFLVSGESLVRNLMLGRKIGEAFGPLLSVGYVPDPFGHIAQLPQILAGFGIDSFVFSRGLGDEGELLGSEFIWRAPDGSNVLAIHQIGWDDRSTGYLNAASLGYPTPWAPRLGPPDLDSAVTQLRDLTKILGRYACTPYLLVNNGCDHLEPQAELPKIIDLANATSAGISFAQGTFQHYVERVRSAAPELKTLAGELRGSRYSPLLFGVLSSRMQLKQLNREAEVLLERWAEPLCAIAWLDGAGYPAPFLWHAWRHLLQNHPHDSICGCSVDQVHDEMLPRFAGAKQIAEHFVSGALHHLVGGANTSGLPAGSLAFAAFNPLPWPRADVVEVTFDRPDLWQEGMAVEVFDSKGRRVPSQVVERYRHQPLQSSGAPAVESVKVAFVAGDLPAFGYRVFGLAPVAPESCEAPAPSSAIENEYFRVFAHPDGSLDVTHKPTSHVVGGAFALVDQADAGDEYTFAPLPGDLPLTNRSAPHVILANSGPACSQMDLTYDWYLPAGLAAERQHRSEERLPCPVQLRLRLYPGIDRLDLEVSLENAVADHRLRLLLPTGLPTDRVVASGHFAVLERCLKLPDGEGWAEQPTPVSHQDGFVAATDGRHTVALIAPGIPEYEPLTAADGTVTLALTLLRCVGWLSRDDIASRSGHAGPGLPAPGAQCPGQHRFSLAVQIGEGDWLDAKVHQTAVELPVRSVAVTSGGTARSSAGEASFMRLEGEGLVLSALKQSETGRWLVVRVFNVSRGSTRGRLSLYRSIRWAVAMRLDETELEPLELNADGTLSFEAPAAKILTFGLTFEP